MQRVAEWCRHGAVGIACTDGALNLIVTFIVPFMVTFMVTFIVPFMVCRYAATSVGSPQRRWGECSQHAADGRRGVGNAWWAGRRAGWVESG